MMTSTDDNNTIVSTCANCGKEGSNLNSCNRCKLVKYCNAACKKKHRSKHKKKCDRRVAEMHDEALFKQPPQGDECPICFLRMPSILSIYLNNYLSIYLYVYVSIIINLNLVATYTELIIRLIYHPLSYPCIPVCCSNL